MKKRLMLGVDNTHGWLVEIDDCDLNNLDFEFMVVNGGWHGHIKDGIMYCGDAEIIANVVILSHDQSRLRGDYNDVFYNFNDPSYIAPEPPPSKVFAEYDDIPF